MILPLKLFIFFLIILITTSISPLLICFNLIQVIDSRLLSEEVQVKFLALELFLESFDFPGLVVKLQFLILSPVVFCSYKLLASREDRLETHVHSNVSRDGFNVQNAAHLLDELEELKTDEIAKRINILMWLFQRLSCTLLVGVYGLYCYKVLLHHNSNC